MSSLFMQRTGRQPVLGIGRGQHKVSLGHIHHYLLFYSNSGMHSLLNAIGKQGTIPLGCHISMETVRTHSIKCLSVYKIHERARALKPDSSQL